MLKAHDWVLANWNQGPYWYEGFVKEVEGDGSRVRVGYPDDSEEWLPGDKVVPLRDYPLGTKLECRWQGGDDYWSAEVVEIDPGVECTGKLYKVRYEDGTEEWAASSLMRFKLAPCPYCGAATFAGAASCPGCGGAA